MYIVNNYTLAVIFCVVTMLCWGSWGNMQKLASKTWRYEYFYWDYVIGVLLFSILSAFTLGSIGSEGRSFLPDLAQADRNSLGSAFLGGVVFDAANILLAAAIAISGLSVAFPVGYRTGARAGRAGRLPRRGERPSPCLSSSASC